ncbi:transcriptional regulator [Flavobacterium album]|uniref:Transcriptional regulator n=1 Tax=Flavobacterium album TaxID=2175091 RepID=A0A2S1QX42_9FLAO|nr:helix-turn-helix domain-containing protein [Flavobacterium album]AWH84972.1 transcriptional regulator [Flavobacterium album]
MARKEIKFEEVFNPKKKEELKDFIADQSALQSKERQLANKLLAISYTLEDYIQSEDENSEILKVLDFVKMYLKALNLTKKELAAYFEMKDSNLHKYLSGERKLNAEVVLKLSAFSHTRPEYWYRIQVKNELIELKKEEKKIKEYQKFDYRNLVAV